MWMSHKPWMIIVIATLFLVATAVGADLEEVAAWRFLTFQPPVGFPGASPQGLPVYAPNAYFTGIESTRNGYFISIPRLRPGLPITLGWVQRPPPGQQLPLDTPIRAFPNWNWHRAAAGGATSAGTNCSALVNVYHTRLDDCGRLWVLDAGITETLVTSTPACPPKMLVFNPTTGQLLRRVEFPPDVFEVYSVFANLVLDTRSPRPSSGANSPCVEPDYVYIADCTAPAIIVYDVRADTAWRTSDLQMYPDPDKGNLTVAGESFKLMDGIIGFALSNPVLVPTPRADTLYSERYLFFNPFASDRIFSVPTSALLSRPKETDDLPIQLLGYKSSQGAPLAVDPKNDSLIFSPFTENVVVSWQPSQNKLAVKALNATLLQAVLDFDVEPNEIILISTRMQKFRRRTATANEVNLRILRIPTNQRSSVKQRNMSRYFRKD